MSQLSIPYSIHPVGIDSYLADLYSFETEILPYKGRHCSIVVWQRTVFGEQARVEWKGSRPQCLSKQQADIKALRWPVIVLCGSDRYHFLQTRFHFQFLHYVQFLARDTCNTIRNQTLKTTDSLCISHLLRSIDLFEYWIYGAQESIEYSVVWQFFRTT